MADGTAFCTKCGAKMAPVATAGGAAAAPAPQPAKSNGGGALKIILIVLGVIAVLGIGAVVVGGLFVKKMVTDSVKTDSTGKVTSVNIGGTKIEALKDPRLVAEKLGVEIFPGARPQQQGASSVSIGGVSTTHAQFICDAPVDDVFNFYKEKYPDANTAENDSDKTLIQGSEDKELLTISTRKQEDGTTLLHITRMTKGVQ